MIEEVKVKLKNHSYVHVECNGGTAMELNEYFSFFAPGYKFMPAFKNKVWDGKIRLFNSKTRELYAGLAPYIEAFCSEEGRDYKFVGDEALTGKHEVDLDFLSSLKVSAGGKAIEPRDYQSLAVVHALTEKRSLLLSPTASGKSLIIYFMMRYYLEKFDKKVLIIVPTTSLVSQMKGDFVDYSEFDANFNADDIHAITAGIDKDTHHRVTVTTWQSIQRLPANHPLLKSAGMVIGDEAHGFKGKALSDIMCRLTDCEFRVGTTGTLDGSNVHQLVLEGLFGKVYKVTTTKELMDQGSLADLDINILLTKYNEQTRKAFGKKTYQEEIDFIVAHEGRNKFISNLALDLDGNTLVLFNYVEKHGKPLHSLIKSKAADGRHIFYVSGETKGDVREDVRRITEGEKNAVIVASLGVFSTGVNIKNIHNIIFASPSKSQVRVLQSIGRGLRKSDDGRKTKLFDLADDLSWKSRSNYTLKHAAERIQIYSKQNFTFVTHEVPIV